MREKRINTANAGQRAGMDKLSTYILVIGILVIISIVFTAWSTIKLNTSLNTLNTKTDSQFNLLNDSLQLESESHFINIISKINPSVVEVLSSPAHNNSGSNNVIYLDDNGKEWNLGAGFSIDNNGDILTANHLVTGAKNIMIVFSDGRPPIQVLRTQNVPDLDLAILFVNSSVPPVKLQSGISSQIGTSIAFTGLPLTTTINGKNVPVEITVKGTISAVIPFIYNNQLVPVYVLGAAANKGNSGGPVFSLRTGEVIEPQANLIRWLKNLK